MVLEKRLRRLYPIKPRSVTFQDKFEATGGARIIYIMLLL